MPIVPTGYGNKNTPVDNDSLFGYDSEGVLNSNFLFSAIRTYVFNGITTTSVDEGVNLYYTDARVAANSTVQGKSDKTDVLEKTNTTTYTPTTDYHPATKKYVDDINVIQKASVAEAVAGTNDTKYITPLSGLSAYGNIVPGTDFVYLESSTEAATSNTVYTKVKEFTMNSDGRFIVSFDAKLSTNTSGFYTDIRVNDISVDEISILGTSYINYSSELNIKQGDKLQLYIRSVNVSITTTIQNFKAEYSLVAGVVPGVIDLN